ncbi:uncharacterized protein TNCV_3103811 [Trichonephila clavipes]|nr:uncharacterized protein TNCV_3103811 [Trichonephila clavipes]
MIDEFTKGSPHTNTFVITAVIESGFVAKDDMIQIHRSPVSRAQHHSKRRRRWVGVKGNTYNGCRDSKFLSTRCFLMVREDTGAPNEGATCAWMASDEAVGCTHAFLPMWRSSG